MIQIYDYPFSLDACILLLLYHTLSKYLRNIFFSCSDSGRHAVYTYTNSRHPARLPAGRYAAAKEALTSCCAKILHCLQDNGTGQEGPLPVTCEKQKQEIIFTSCSFSKKFCFTSCIYIRKVVLLLQSNLHMFLHFQDIL